MSRHLTVSPSSFVPRNDREQLLAVYADLVYERGYELVALRDVARHAGVDEAVVAGFWADEEDCLVEALDVATQQAFSRVAQVFLRSRGDGPRAAHLALETLLTHMAASPAFLHLAIVVLPTLDGRAALRHKSVQDMFAELLAPGFAALGVAPPRQDIVGQVLTGGIFEVLHRHAVEGRIAELPAAVPGLSHVCVATFFGLEEAARVCAPETAAVR